MDRELGNDIPKKWFVIHTYSGYENKVQATLERKVQSMNIADEIHKILIPMQEELEEKDGETKVVRRKLYPGYVMVQMNYYPQQKQKVDSRAWYIVRNTPGVTGFVGTETTPIPLSNAEVAKLLKSQGIGDDSQAPTYQTDLTEGETVRIKSGAFIDREGVVRQIDVQKGVVHIEIDAFGGNTDVELGLSDVEPLL